MSSTPVETSVAAVRRVRHQARDAVVVMTFSATTSVAVAVAVVLLSRLGR